MKESPYFNQVRLILRAMPYIVAEKRFALKGGTAINLFVRDMPRLSIDIDLTWFLMNRVWNHFYLGTPGSSPRVTMREPEGDDIQKVEDIQMIMVHMTMQRILQKLNDSQASD